MKGAFLLAILGVVVIPKALFSVGRNVKFGWQFVFHAALLTIKVKLRIVTVAIVPQILLRHFEHRMTTIAFTFYGPIHIPRFYDFHTP
jgi:hypothetical protein